MVIRASQLARARQRGALMTELMVALALLAGALLPLAYSLNHERQLARAIYQRAVAMEIVDGEFEVLLAGGWRNLSAGRQPYHLTAASTVNLPPGGFWVTLEPGNLRLEWLPTTKSHGGKVLREANIR